MRATLLALLLATAAPAARAGDDACTFDRSHQAAVLAVVAASEGGAVADLATGAIAWTRDGEGTTTFAYGGCVHLGSSVQRATPLPKPRSRAQVFALARALATAHWDNEMVSAGSAAAALAAGLEAGRYRTEISDARTLYSVDDPMYTELHVEHAYADGVDRVTIAWVGAF